MFDAMDKDRNGVLDKDEIAAMILQVHSNKQWLAKYSGKVEEKVEETLKHFDSDGDGKLNFDEFLAMLSTGKPWTRLLDPTLKGAELARLERQHANLKQSQNTQPNPDFSASADVLSRAVESHAELLKKSYGGSSTCPVPAQLKNHYQYTGDTAATYDHHLYGAASASRSAVSRASDPNAHLIAARSSAADLGYRMGGDPYDSYNMPRSHHVHGHLVQHPAYATHRAPGLDYHGYRTQPMMAGPPDFRPATYVPRDYSSARPAPPSVRYHERYPTRGAPFAYSPAFPFPY